LEADRCVVIPCKVSALEIVQGVVEDNMRICTSYSEAMVHQC
jgi:hypothetical protein